MSLEDFAREVQGKPPKNRSLLDRWAYSDEDGCSYDMQVATSPISKGIALALFASMLAVAWASGDPVWDKFVDRLAAIWNFVKWAIIG